MSISRGCSAKDFTGTSSKRTGRKAGLQLLRLIGILEDEGVQVLLAPDLELDGGGLLVLLDPRGCFNSNLVRNTGPS